MENKGILAIIGVFVLVLFGYWIFNTPEGYALRQSLRQPVVAQQALMANSVAAVTPGYTYTSPTTTSNPGYAYTASSAPVGYITYPIAKSTGVSYYNPGTSYSTTSSYYYTAPDTGYYPQGNCYMVSPGTYSCMNGSYTYSY